jgi:hypothetical protein
MISGKIAIKLGAIAGTLVAAVAIALPASAQTTPNASALPNAPAGKDILAVINPATGQIISETVTSAIATPSVTHSTICNTGWACWESGAVPYANQGFYGTAGTVTGSWPDRDEFWTGNYTASFAYTYDGVSHSEPSFPANYGVTFGGALVTGTRATIN